MFAVCILSSQKTRNDFTDIKCSCYSNVYITRKNLAHDLVLATDIPEDTGKDGNEILSSLKGDALMDSIDEVDYFDSED